VERFPAGHLDERAMEIWLLSFPRKDLVAEHTSGAEPAALAPARALSRARAPLLVVARRCIRGGASKDTRSSAEERSAATPPTLITGGSARVLAQSHTCQAEIGERDSGRSAGGRVATP
jgi:hypothetical protein